MQTQTISKPHAWLNPRRFLLTAILVGVVLFSVSCTKETTPGKIKKGDVIYTQSNNFHTNQNAILAYRDNGYGVLEPLSGSPFYTGGSGVGNPEQLLGPLDSDQELRISDDGKFLLAVNSGSNTIAVFAIKEDGVLQPVAGSPFYSGGQTPVSIDISWPYVFVVNKSQNPLHPATKAPNYAVFRMDDNGKLTALSKTTFETTPGVSPTQALVSRDKKFLFGCDFLGFMQMPPVGTLRSFSIDANGGLVAVAGTPYTIDGAGGALGLWQHPKANILYVGFPVQGKVGIYGIDPGSGALSFKSSVASGAAACWLRTNKSGSHLYVLNSAENSVGVFNSLVPDAPVAQQNFKLKYPGPLYAGPGGAMFPTSEDFSLAFSKDEKHLYVVCQHTNKDFSIGNYNFLHSLAIGADGTLTEETEPVSLPVPANVRPKGLAVYAHKF